jgi:hypothetical protein
VRLLCLTLLVIAASAQDPPLDLSPEADQQDDVILQNTLYVSITADDIYRSEPVRELAQLQAEEMMKASRRRMDRQEQRVEALKNAVSQGKATQVDLKAAIQEMNRRIEVGYLAMSRANILQEIVSSARAEDARRRSTRGPAMERYNSTRPFTPAVLRSVETAFLRQFGRPLPISAQGDTALHRALGLDHSGRVDVAIHPDSPEGTWLRKYLESQHIPYYGFRTAMLGAATAPHIHIGPGSVRYRETRAAAPGQP